MSTCHRCGNEFIPEPLGLPSEPLTLSRCCDTCKLRNLFDGFDLPTPPDLLDIHTKWPTLTQAEFETKLDVLKHETLPDDLVVDNADRL